MSILRGLERRGADPKLNWGNSFIPSNGMTGMVTAGVAMNDDTALSLSTVATCVAILADAVATLPVTTTRLKKGQPVVVDPPPLIVNPWPEGGAIRQTWMSQVMFSLLLRGNFFGLVSGRDERGFPLLIKPVHPDDVYASRDIATGARQYRIKGIIVDPSDMIHIPSTLTPPGGFIGLNPIEYMRGSWGLAKAAETYGGQFFANSANASGVIEVPGDLEDDEVLAMIRAWKQSHQGVGNASQPALLTGGATWKQLSINPADAQFLQTRSFQQGQIASFFRIPEHMIGLQDRTSSWGTGIEQMQIGFVIDTLLPWLSRIEAYLNQLTAPQITVQFDLSPRLRGDTLQRYQGYTLSRNGGWMNIDEIRKAEGMPPLPDGLGQDYWAPLNFAPVDKIQDGTAGAASSGGIGGGVGNSPDAPPAPSSDNSP